MEEVNEDDAKKFAKEKNIDFFSVSAKNDYGIKELFTQIGKKFAGRDDLKFCKKEELNIQGEDTNNSEKKIIGKSRSVKLKASNVNNNIKQKCC